MSFRAEIMKDVSYDPYYKVSFFYEDESIKIEKGYAEIVRKPPRPQISFDPFTEELLGEASKAKLELELLNIVMNHLFTTRNTKSFGYRTANL